MPTTPFHLQVVPHATLTSLHLYYLVTSRMDSMQRHSHWNPSILEEADSLLLEEVTLFLAQLTLCSFARVEVDSSRC